MAEERVRFDEYGRAIKPDEEDSKDKPSRERMDPFEYEQELRRREELAYRRRTAKWINPALYASIACAGIMVIAFVAAMIAGGRPALLGIPLAIVVLSGLASQVLAITSLALIRSSGVRAHVQTKYGAFVILIALAVFILVGMVIAGVMG